MNKKKKNFFSLQLENWLNLRTRQATVTKQKAKKKKILMYLCFLEKKKNVTFGKSFQNNKVYYVK